MREASTPAARPQNTDPPAHGGFFVRGSRALSGRRAQIVAVALLLIGGTGAMRSDRVENARIVADLTARLADANGALAARTGELELARLELRRLETIHRQAGHYGIPADLAAAIHDIAVAEGIAPALAFSLVRVESQFTARAVSSQGAIGLTQVMPTTALDLEPGITARELLDEETNLRLGFRYLNRMIRQYRGDLRLALLAYNRGPARVDSIRRFGGDPGNGYARKVLNGRRGD